MNIKKYFAVLAISFLFLSCGDDDDPEFQQVALRDFGEQFTLENSQIREYLQTHFYNYEDFQNLPDNFDFNIVFDTISGVNSDKTPLIEQVEERILNRNSVEHSFYVLKAREGNGEAVTFADSSLVRFEGNVLSRDALFDTAINPIWFDLTATVDGFSHGLAGARGPSSFEISSDGTIDFTDDFEIGAVFMPSGLGFYATPPSGSGINQYESLVFIYDLLGVNQSDHDGDGIRTLLEDVDNNGFLFDENDNTDEDQLVNYLDPDDDNDGVTTDSEIVSDDEGNLISFLDTDNDGISNHLDSDDDGDGIDTIDEINVNFTTGVIIFPDSDEDGTPDYLDADS